MTARAKAGCQACRVRHLKCDHGTPTCGRCQESGRECTRGYPYRHSSAKFSNGQTWLQIPEDLNFVDETENILNDYDGDSDGEGTMPPPDIGLAGSSQSTPSSLLPSIDSPMSVPSRRVVLPRLHSIATSTHTSPFVTVPEPNPSEQPPMPSNPARLSHSDQQLSSRASSTTRDAPGNIATPATISYTSTPPTSAFTENETPNPPPTIYLNTPVWPLRDAAEARLLRNFVQKLAIWLDLCDPKQHFQVEVPKRAGTCPILLNAIFALSARHLSHTGNYDHFASAQYHQECLRDLIPVLGNSEIVSDETLFAAVIILRVLEEIDMPENDVQSHMLGIQVFVSGLSSRDPYSMGRGLSEAAFWVGLRQEIYYSMMKHKAIMFNLEHCPVDRSVEPASDFGWANRAVVHCADVLNCCFGPSGVSLDHWSDLKDCSERWKRMAPSSFAPIFYREPDRAKREVFPEIWYSMACHIIGVQHHKLGEILLSIFDPRIPKVGGNRSLAVRSMEKEIKPNLRSLCGIGLCNRWTPPGMFTASMGIAICGERFDDRMDQEAILNVLVMTEKDHARPTALVQEQMKRSWGWIPAA